MKVIKIKAKQSMVNYKRPMSYIAGETYPLPPYSTIIGMIHTACGFTEYHPMKISIQGNPKSIVSDMQIKYAGGSHKYENNRHTLFTISDNQKIGYVRGVGNVQLITDIDLIIHILPEDETEFDKIYDGLCNPVKYLSLGRHEDLLNITDVMVVDCKEVKDAITTNNMYIKQENLGEIKGTVYKLKKVYRIHPKTNIRYFDEIIKVNYVPKNIELSDVFVDEEENAICLV